MMGTAQAALRYSHLERATLAVPSSYTVAMGGKKEVVVLGSRLARLPRVLVAAWT